MISCQITYTLHLCLVIMSDYIHFTSFSCNHMPPSGEFGGISTRNQGGAPSIDLALCMPRNSRCSRLRTPQYRRRWVVQGRCTSCESWVFRGGNPGRRLNLVMPRLAGQLRPGFSQWLAGQRQWWQFPGSPNILSPSGLSLIWPARVMWVSTSDWSGHLSMCVVAVCSFHPSNKQSLHSIISSVFLTDFELPPRSSHFESDPKDGKKQATNQVDGLPRTSSWTLNRLPAHTLQKRGHFWLLKHKICFTM